MSDFICTIGIPAYNEQETILHLLSDLYNEVKLLSGKWQIIIVANGCTDNTMEQVLAFGSKHWQLVDHKQRIKQDWWYFAHQDNLYQVCAIVEKKKSTALNIIHRNSQSEAVILLDADIRLCRRVLSAMLQALKNHPTHSIAVPRYQGTIEPFRLQKGLPDYLRMQVCKAINHFDTYVPRLDGKALVYRRKLISQHPPLITCDMWLEGQAWMTTQGCIYLQTYQVNYRFPSSFHELTVQYARYMETLQKFKLEYAELYTALSEGRQSVKAQRQQEPSIVNRFIGWAFFRWIDIYNLFFNKNRVAGDEEWEVISTTKR